MVFVGEISISIYGTKNHNIEYMHSIFISWPNQVTLNVFYIFTIKKIVLFNSLYLIGCLVKDNILKLIKHENDT